MVGSIDSELVSWFSYGIAIGLVIVSTLVLFPGDGGAESAKDHADAAQPKNKAREQQQSLYDHYEGSYQGWTPHQKLNYATYLILLVGAAVFLDQTYGGLLSLWLRETFPREAKVLGF